MSSSRSTLLLVTLLLVSAISVSYFAFFKGSDSGGEGGLEVGASVPEVEVAGASTDLGQVQPPSGDLLSPEEEPDERIDVVQKAEEAEEELAEAERQYVTGRVQFGFAVPADEELYVMTVDGERSAARLYSVAGVADSVWDTEVKKRGLYEFARVEADGSFRVGLPADQDTAHLALTGRYVFSRRTTSIDLGGQEEDVVLTGELGSWITGTLRAPRSVGDSISLEDADVELGLDLTGPFNAMEVAADAYGLESETDSAGTFELRGVTAVVTHSLLVRHEEMAPTFDLGIKTEPGEHLELVIRMQQGATVRGRVLSEAGTVLSGAEVSVSLRGTLGAAVGELRTTETDEAGVFELKRVLTGRQLELKANLDGMRPLTHKVDGKFRDGQVVEGLSLVMSQGEVVSGRVLYPDGQPATGVRVFVSGDAARTDLTMMGVRMAALGNSETETGTDGGFELTGLAEGPYRLGVRVENDEGEHAGSWRVRRGDVAGGTRDLVLELEGMTPVSGMVTTASEREIEEFTVHFTLQGSGGVMGIGADRKREAFEPVPDGSFLMRSVPPGTWDVMVVAPGFAQSETIEVLVPQSADAPQLVFELEPAAGVSGIVYDSFSDPVAGAKVSIEVPMADRLQSAFTGEGNFTLSDHEGRYLLENLDPGAHTVIANLKGFAGSEPRAVDLESGEVAIDVALTLRVGGSLRGEILDDDGKPAAGRMIIVQSLPTYATQHMNSSDSDGGFYFEHLEPGTWQVVATPNFMTGELEMGGGDGMGDLLSKLEMDMVDIVEGEETYVQLGKPPENPVELQGRVIHDGEPVPNALITLVTDEMRGLGDLKMATTSDTGEFAVQLDKSGSYLITVQTSMSTGRQNSIEFSERVPQDISFHRVELKLPIAGISGRVLDPDGKPAASCRVTLNVDGGIAYGSFLGGHYSEIATDDEGNYEIPHLRAGSYSVSAGGATMAGMFGNDSFAGRMVRDGIEVSEGHWVRGIDFKLERPGSLVGTVRDINGGVLAGVAVFVRDAQGRLLERFSMVNTDVGGRFEYHGVAEGDYTLSAKKGGQVSESSPLVTVKSDESASADLTLREGTIFVVTVIDKNGDEVRARISVQDEAGNEMAGMLSLDEVMQNFGKGFSTKEQRVGPLSAGKYRVEAVLDDGRSTRKNVRASGQAERKIKLRIG
jgi:uncharacterized GH25 family protein